MEVLEQKKNSALRSRSIKAPAVKTEIIARRVQGQSRTKIAKEMGIAPNTVSSIVALSNIDSMMEDGRLGAMKRLPKALDVLDVRLEKNSESAAIWLLDKCFDESKVQGKKMGSDVTLTQTLNVLLHGSTGETANVSAGEVKVVEQTPASDNPSAEKTKE